jgi:parallel beta-helix repeat protein
MPAIRIPPIHEAAAGATPEQRTDALATLGGMGPVFDVRTYGAVGDGVANDTAAIQAAITAAAAVGGGVVFVPPRPHLLTATLMIPASDRGITIRGIGNASRLIWSADVIGIEAFGRNDLAVLDLSLTGARTTDAQMADGHAIYVGNASRIRVERCRIADWPGHGIHLIGFDGRLGGLNLPQGVHDAWVRDNFVSRCNSGIFPYNDAQRVVVSGNHVERCASVGIFLDDSHITSGAETPRAARACVVESNTVHECTNVGIALAGTVETIIKGNVIQRSGQAASTLASGMVIQTTQNPQVESLRNIIEGNIIAWSTNYGLVLQGASNNLIRGNHIYNNSYLRPSGGVAQVRMERIIIGSTTIGSNRNCLDDNFVEDDSPQSTTGNQVHIVDADCVGNVVRNNVLRGGGSSTKLNDAGTGTVKLGNIEDTTA